MAGGPDTSGSSAGMAQLEAHSEAVFSEVLEAHSEAVFSGVLEAAAKFNVCQQLEARVWHHLTLELGVTCRVPNIPCSRQRALPGPLSRPPPLSGPPPPPDPHLHFLTRRPPPLPSAHKLPFLVFLPYIDPVPYPVLTQCRTMPYTSPLVGFVSKLMPFSGLMMPISCLKMGALKIL